MLSFQTVMTTNLRQVLSLDSNKDQLMKFVMFYTNQSEKQSIRFQSLSVVLEDDIPQHHLRVLWFCVFSRCFRGVDAVHVVMLLRAGVDGLYYQSLMLLFHFVLVNNLNICRCALIIQLCKVPPTLRMEITGKII